MATQGRKSLGKLRFKAKAPIWGSSSFNGQRWVAVEEPIDRRLRNVHCYSLGFGNLKAQSLESIDVADFLAIAGEVFVPLNLRFTVELPVGPVLE